MTPFKLLISIIIVSNLTLLSGQIDKVSNLENRDPAFTNHKEYPVHA